MFWFKKEPGYKGYHWHKEQEEKQKRRWGWFKKKEPQQIGVFNGVNWGSTPLTKEERMEYLLTHVKETIEELKDTNRLIGLYGSLVDNLHLKRKAVREALCDTADYITDILCEPEVN